MTRLASIVASLAAAAGLASSANAANFSLNWLNMSPTAFGSPVPNASVFNLPGVGPVTVTYSMPAANLHARFQSSIFYPGSVTSGPDTYNWSVHEAFAVTSFAQAPAISTSWDITYTFTSTLAPGTIVLGVQGLGATNSPVVGTTTATCLQNGQFLGDHISGQNYGATQFTPGVGIFNMQNSVTGPGGQNPHWNTELGLVKIMDPITSLTVRFNQLSGDGVGVNIASVVPTPGTAALLGLGGVCVLRRRRN